MWRNFRKHCVSFPSAEVGANKGIEHRKIAQVGIREASILREPDTPSVQKPEIAGIAVCNGEQGVGLPARAVTIRIETD
ncbi:hypothetical protein SDC9_141650 [bioreactor metagenome]|uniref:Uncharacterized protein n=1 Tax=bioreactor metagenome TaxID=1076179 RepID=A0A645DY96_9ZZZZ